MSKRIEFTRKDKAKIIARANHKCEKCSAMLKTGEGEVDHILPCALGGEATVANGRLLCRVCHAEKTADDIKRIRKSDRQRDKATGAVRPKSALSSHKQPKAPSSKITPPRRSLYEPVQERQI
ncbi:HNH endonuclease [Pseudochrobactrum sp. MP213Fo]|uniref:HNH endonuclease n=1 Tax=Pseudochrobactrum sp. MP213Fo TaxID=3022250 RepID=UPI003B9E3061